jgi:flotillin
MFGFKIAEPNEALIVSGKRGGGDGAAEAQQYKIVASGNRVFVWPIIQSARTLSLDLKQATVPVNCVTTQGIPVTIKGVVAFKVGADNASISNAAQRFLHDPTTMQDRVHELFAGHIRGIVGSLTVEEMIRERESLTREARNATSLDMEKMGLVIDSLQIAEIDDPSGYIENLSKPDIARVQMESRIAQAQRDREASQQEAENAAQVAEAQRASAIKQAGYRAEVEKAEAVAAQSGPLAAAQAQKAVVEQQTEVATLNASRREQELIAEVQKPADADRYQREVAAEADKRAAILNAEAQAESNRQVGLAQAEVTKETGSAEAEVIRAKGIAEGEALKSRADGLAQESEAVIGQQLADRLPDIVRAAASAFDHVDNITMLNGAEGVTDSLLSIAATGRAMLDAVRPKAETGGSLNGQREREPARDGESSS